MDSPPNPATNSGTARGSTSSSRKTFRPGRSVRSTAQAAPTPTMAHPMPTRTVSCTVCASSVGSSGRCSTLTASAAPTDTAWLATAAACTAMRAGGRPAHGSASGGGPGVASGTAGVAGRPRAVRPAVLRARAVPVVVVEEAHLPRPPVDGGDDRPVVAVDLGVGLEARQPLFGGCDAVELDDGGDFGV